MNKKILTLSLAVISATTLSVGAFFLANKDGKLSVDADGGKKTIILDKDSVKNITSPYDDVLQFDLEGDNAFGYDEEKFKIEGANIYGSNLSAGGDHLLQVSDIGYGYWSFQLPTVYLRGTHRGFVSLNLLKETEVPGTYDVLSTYHPSDTNYDIEKDLYDLTVYEDIYTIPDVETLTIDRITITYTCEA